MYFKKFCTTGHCVTKVGLSHIGTHDQDGNEYQENIFPFKITFVPTGDIQFMEERPGSYQEFMDQFKQISVGTNLYTFKVRFNIHYSLFLFSIFHFSYFKPTKESKRL